MRHRSRWHARLHGPHDAQSPDVLRNSAGGVHDRCSRARNYRPSAPERTEWVVVDFADERRNVCHWTLVLVTKPATVPVAPEERPSLRSRVVPELRGLPVRPLVRHAPDRTVLDERHVVPADLDRHANPIAVARRRTPLDQLLEQFLGAAKGQIRNRHMGTTNRRAALVRYGLYGSLRALPSFIQTAPGIAESTTARGMTAPLPTNPSAHPTNPSICSSVNTPISHWKHPHLAMICSPIPV